MASNEIEKADETPKVFDTPNPFYTTTNPTTSSSTSTNTPDGSTIPAIGPFQSNNYTIPFPTMQQAQTQPIDAATFENNNQPALSGQYLLSPSSTPLLTQFSQSSDPGGFITCLDTVPEEDSSTPSLTGEQDRVSAYTQGTYIGSSGLAGTNDKELSYNELQFGLFKKEGSPVVKLPGSGPESPQQVILPIRQALHGASEQPEEETPREEPPKEEPPREEPPREEPPREEPPREEPTDREPSEEYPRPRTVEQLDNLRNVDRRISALQGPSTIYLQQTQDIPWHTDSPKKLLIISDLNGCLLHRRWNGSRQNRGSRITPRPEVESFLNYALDNHHLMIWTSAHPGNALKMVKNLLPNRAHRDALVDIWTRNDLALSAEDFGRHCQVYKRLDRVWADWYIQGIGGGGWNQSNTILLEDSAQKAATAPHNLVLVPEYMGISSDESDRSTMREVIEYLEEARWYEDVSCFMRRNPFRASSTTGQSSNQGVQSASWRSRQRGGQSGGQSGVQRTGQSGGQRGLPLGSREEALRAAQRAAPRVAPGGWRGARRGARRGGPGV